MKVLLAVDGSKYGGWAAQWLGRVPFAKAPDVRAVHVVDLAALRAPFVVQPAMPGYEKFLQDEARRLEARAERVRADTAALLASLGLRSSVAVVKGPVAKTILDQAGRNTQLVVLGNRGLGDFDRLFLGSVSNKVVLHAPCSVLVVKRPPRPVTRILLAVDGSQSSDRAIGFVLRELRPPKGARIEVTVVHVLPPFAYSRVVLSGMDVVSRCAGRLAAAGYRAREMRMAGDPAEEIVRAAARGKTDLLVTGAKGLSALGRFFLGSVSTKLIRHSPCSVLVVR